MVAPNHDLPLWFKCTTELPQKAVWRDQVGLRLWLYLLCLAKRANKNGEVRFSYEGARHAIAWDEGKKRVIPSKKVVRAALLRLARGQDRNVIVPASGTRQGQGGGQGWFVVTLCDYETWYGTPNDAVQGSGQGDVQGRAKVGPRSGTPSTEREKEGEAEASAAALDHEAIRRSWERLTGEHQITRESSLSEARARLSALMARDGAGPTRVALEGWIQSEQRVGRHPKVWNFLKSREAAAAPVTAELDLDALDLRRDMGLDS